jgi:phenylalanyl-tRNA synthetase beta chain
MNNGVKPINSTLDKLAYVTLLTNVPTAAYDADKISSALSVELSNGNESFVGFDKKSYKLNSNDIVIKSNGKIVGLAGIMGAKDYGVNNATKDIYIEIANFNYFNIRATSIRLNIFSDAAKRFSKPISIYLNNLTLQFVAEQFMGLQISRPIVNFKQQQQIAFDVDYDFINKILGINLSSNVIQASLKYYGFQFDNHKCIAPLHRLDITTSQDLSEEIVKFININELPITPIIGEINITSDNKEYELITKIKSLLNSNFFNEVKTYNLTSLEDLNEFNIFKYTDFIKIENSHNLSRTHLRSNLISALLKIYQFNDSYKTKLQPIFEIQKIYANRTSHLNLTIIAPEIIHLDRISDSKIMMNVNVLKAISNEFAKLLNTEFEYFVTSESNVFYNNELLAVQCNGKLIGYIGSIKSSKLVNYDLSNQTIYCLSINLELLLEMYTKPIMHFVSVNNLMPIYKDISFIIHPLEKITNLLHALDNLDFIQSYEFIDRYVITEGEQISYTLRFRFNNIKGTNTKIIETYLTEIENKIIENHANIRR